jgi:hypothetical protein
MNPRTTSGPDNVRGPADECKKPGAHAPGPVCDMWPEGKLFAPCGKPAVARVTHRRLTDDAEMIMPCCEEHAADHNNAWTIVRTEPIPRLTPSEVSTARVLAAWLGSTAPKEDEPGNALRMLGTGLILDGLALPDRSPTHAGAALLDRAKKAGAL